jgi:hypothetical protein
MDVHLAGGVRRRRTEAAGDEQKHLVADGQAAVQLLLNHVVFG